MLVGRLAVTQGCKTCVANITAAFVVVGGWRCGVRVVVDTRPFVVLCRYGTYTYVSGVTALAAATRLLVLRFVSSR